jgi:type II secretory ATPase GspE/PulE/Tfp pilus assembly ATPase PilB-like protein
MQANHKGFAGMAKKTAEEARQKQEEVTKNRAELLRVHYTDTREEDATRFLPDMMSLETIDKLHMVPVNATVNQLLLGFTLDTPQTSMHGVEDNYPQYNVTFTLISKDGFQELYQQYYDYAHKDDPPEPTPQEIAEQLADKILEVNEQISEQEELNLFDEKFAKTGQIELFEFLAQQAYLLSASDIHLEPEKDQGGARVRFRIDGRLHIVGRLEQDRYTILLNSLQMRSRIRWNADYPQTGSTTETLINQDKENVEVNMRIETVPTLHGSDAVIRIFNMEEAFLHLDNIGLSEEQRKPVDQLIARPHGMALMVGPTGSGKSSTLYAILNKLNTPEVKIITLEDPIEYEIRGITQIPVDTDNTETFSNKLRAVLREDPDIIMVGEIRDEETARTALQASLTGHLVLSTFHANSAAAAVTRMLDLIDYNPLLASAFRLITSQRLVRQLCPHCKQPYTPDEEIASIIARALQGTGEQPEELTLYKAVGCKECHHIGYLGRMMVLEQFQVTESISREITTNPQGSSDHFQELAIGEGMTTMLQDGVRKALAGHTSMEEILRAVELR